MFLIRNLIAKRLSTTDRDCWTFDPAPMDADESEWISLTIGSNPKGGAMFYRGHVINRLWPRVAPDEPSLHNIERVSATDYEGMKMDQHSARIENGATGFNLKPAYVDKGTYPPTGSSRGASLKRKRSPVQNKYSPLLKNVLAGMLYNPHLEDPNKAKVTQQWRSLMNEMISQPPEPADSKSFHTKWTESGHKLRELVADDHLLMDTLRIWLPPNIGADQTLYRGESIERWEIGNIGACWTTRCEVAKMFASGLNKIGNGGVLLSTSAPAASIVAGPSDHSVYLQEIEYVVDRRCITQISVLEFFRNI